MFTFIPGIQDFDSPDINPTLLQNFHPKPLYKKVSTMAKTQLKKYLQQTSLHQTIETY